MDAVLVASPLRPGGSASRPRVAIGKVIDAGLTIDEAEARALDSSSASSTTSASAGVDHLSRSSLLATRDGDQALVVSHRGEIRPGCGTKSCASGRRAARRPVRSGFRRGPGRELYGADEARAQMFALLPGCPSSSVPRPVGLAAFTAERRIKRSASARSWAPARARHRPAADLAILQAGDDRQPHRLAGRLVGDARVAERLRRRHRPPGSSPPVVALVSPDLVGLAVRDRHQPVHAFA